MTLISLSRPIQKGLSRLLLAGTNAVAPNAAMDQVAFRDQQQIDAASQPQQQQQQQQQQFMQALGAAELQQLTLALEAPPPPAAAAAPAVSPEVSRPTFAQPAWQVSGRWFQGAESWPAVSFIAGYNAHGGADAGAANDAQAAASGAASNSSAEDALPASGSEGECRASAGQGAGALDMWRWEAAWPIGHIFLPVLLQPCPVESATPSNAADAASTASSLPSRANGGGLPGRTGASRRQRRKRQQQLQHQGMLDQQLQQSPQGQQMMQFPVPVAVPLDAEWCDAGLYSAASTALWSEAALCADAATEICAESAETASVVVAGEAGDTPSMLFPPTPESSPCSSPRFYCGAGPELLWLEQPAFDAFAESASPTAIAASPAAAAQPQRRRKNQAAAQALGAPEVEKAAAQLASEDASERAEALDFVSRNFWPLATSAAGCRVAQRALESASTIPEQEILAQKMRGHVIEACVSPHANHVLQKCVEVLPPEHLQFVVDEMRGNVLNAARHRYGCRVLERLIEHCPQCQTKELVEEVLQGASQLCRHTFGNFVVQHVLEHGTAAQRHDIAEMLYADLQRLARHRVASHVVRAALVHCEHDDRTRLMEAMRSDAAELADLAHHHCGSFVVREMRREMKR